MSKIATHKVALVYMLKRHVLCKTLHERIEYSIFISWNQRMS